MTAPFPPNLRVVSALEANDPHFDITGDIRSLAEAEDRHFWHLSRNRFIVERIRALGVSPPARIVELGCGGGCVTAHLATAGYDVTGIEGHVPLAVRAAQRAPGARFVVADLTRGTGDLDVQADFEVAGLFDVIEHLDEPRAALEEALSLCKVGGFVVGTVPALGLLWSLVDEESGHRCRYEKADLERVCASVKDAEIVEIAFFNRVLVPMLWLQRRTMGRKRGDELSDRNLAVPAKPINAALYAVVRAEQKLARLLDGTPLPGASLWFALRRTR